MADDKSPRPRPSAETSSSGGDGGRSSSGDRGAQRDSGQSSAAGRGGKPAGSAPTSERRPDAAKRPEASKQPPKRSPASRIARRAAQQLLELTGKEPESIIGLKRNEEGWQVQVEVLEVNRIPHTTDLLALYEVDVDSDGELLAYRRQSRYVRGSASEEGRK
jgi:gas vesicle protein GvpO